MLLLITILYDIIICITHCLLFSGEYNEIEVFHNGDDATISNLDTFTEYVFSIKVNTIKGPGKSSKPLICRTSESCKMFIQLFFIYIPYQFNLVNVQHRVSK